MSQSLAASFPKLKINAVCILMPTNSKDQYASSKALEHLDKEFWWILGDDIPTGLLVVPSNVKNLPSMSGAKLKELQIGKGTLYITE